MGVFAALLNTLVPLAAASATPAASIGCTPIEGWEQVLADNKVHWIVIGELHGTAETPAIFADAVCLTAAKRGPVVVGLEIPSGDQARIDSFMNSDGGPAAQAEFFKALIWHMPMKDGRSSEAFFHLFERLRQMHKVGLVARVVAFQDSSPAHDPPGDQGPYEQRMAAIVRGAAAEGATVVALAGYSHARKTEANFGKPFMPMASHLPKGQTLTLFADGNGGSSWFCSGPTPEACGSHPSHRQGEPAKRGVEPRPVDEGAYDGVLNLGTPTTASPPQSTP
jgi:hypothetical protein